MRSQYEIPLDTPVLYLKCDEAFEGLTTRERRYSHHLSKCAWWGSFIIQCQTSPESPIIFSLLTRLFRTQSLESLKTLAKEKSDFSDDEFKSLLLYYCGIAYNLGNYLGFGDRKFIPAVAQGKLLHLLKLSDAYKKDPELIDRYISKCIDAMYKLHENTKFLGLPPNGITMYFTPNCCNTDVSLTNEYLANRNIEAWNTRLLKYFEDGEPILDIRKASIAKDPLTLKYDLFKGQKFRVSNGDFSFFLKKIAEEMKTAKIYAENELEMKMLNKYIEHFTTGNIQQHKEGSTYWVKNKSPCIETYTGFIEVYRDPTNQRAEFESFVAVVNREQSRKFDTLVSRAENEFLSLLPWGKDFEVDVFQRPDFSSLDILSFATSGLPIGINIPNYPDVKEEEGFKNVSLTNVMAAHAGLSGGPFLSDLDNTLREKYGSVALEICVGLHELLGHGCGKYLRRKADGSLNFDPEKVKNPFTGEDVLFYKIGENYNSRFTDISSAYEECRAEVVAIYLGLCDQILDVFSVCDTDKENVKYIMWLDMFYSGLKGLEMYQLDQRKWGQAHCQARFVILNVAIEAGEGLVTLEETKGGDGLPDLIMTIDRTKINTVGKKAMGEFLRKLQIYRSMGDAKAGRTMFEKYSEVQLDGKYPFGKWHDIIVRRKQPRMILTMPNTRVSGDDVEIISYNSGAEQNISSWIDRFSPSEYDEIEKALIDISDSWTK